MRPPYRKPTVQLSDKDGNIFGIIGRVKRALKNAGADTEYVTKYTQEVMSGDYNNALQVCMKYVNVT